MSKPLAEATYSLKGKGYNGKEVNETVKAELHTSGAFKYGNGTCTVLIWGNGYEQGYDTRYSSVNEKNFTEFAKKLIKQEVYKDIKVEVIK